MNERADNETLAAATDFRGLFSPVTVVLAKLAGEAMRDAPPLRDDPILRTAWVVYAAFFWLLTVSFVIAAFRVFDVRSHDLHDPLFMLAVEFGFQLLGAYAVFLIIAAVTRLQRPGPGTE
jgi:hypothetical protein